MRIESTNATNNNTTTQNIINTITVGEYVTPAGLVKYQRYDYGGGQLKGRIYLGFEFICCPVNEMWMGWYFGEKDANDDSILKDNFK